MLLQAINKIEADAVETDSRRINRENGIAAHSRHSEESSHNGSPCSKDFNELGKFTDGIVELKNNCKRFLVFRDCRKRGSYHSDVRCRLGMCGSLYVLGIAMVIVAYGIHWFREIHRTNLNCII